MLFRSRPDNNGNGQDNSDNAPGRPDNNGNGNGRGVVADAVDVTPPEAGSEPEDTPASPNRGNNGNQGGQSGREGSHHATTST